MGKPIRATSACSFSSRLNQFSCPLSPCSAKAGRPTAVREEASVALAAESALGGQPAIARAVEVDEQFALTAVDHGADWHDDDVESLPREPCWRLDVPCWPSVARRNGWSRNPSSEAWLWSATIQTSPPLPPSPPSGPPLATWASRRKLTQPAPPSPALACNCAKSTKVDTPFILRPDLGNLFHSMRQRRLGDDDARLRRPVRDARRGELRRFASCLVTTDLGDSTVCARSSPASVFGSSALGSTSLLARTFSPITRLCPRRRPLVISARTPSAWPGRTTKGSRARFDTSAPLVRVLPTWRRREKLGHRGEIGRLHGVTHALGEHLHGLHGRIGAATRGIGARAQTTSPHPRCSHSPRTKSSRRQSTSARKWTIVTREQAIGRLLKCPCFPVIQRLLGLFRAFQRYDSITQQFEKLPLTCDFVIGFWPETAISYEKSQYLARFA